MLGLGETLGEVLDVLADLRSVGCDLLTLGQYLQPATDKYLPVVRYIPPEEFVELGQLAKSLGFRDVASGPLSAVVITLAKWQSFFEAFEIANPHLRSNFSVAIESQP